MATVVVASFVPIHGSSVSAATVSWDGDTSTAWATGANWIDGVAPADDTTSDLAAFVFAALPSNQPNAGTRSVSGIVVGDGTMAVPAFTIAGTTLSIGAGSVTKLAASGSVTIAADIALAANQTWINDSASVLAISGAVSANGHPFAVAGSGSTVVTGILSGSAGVQKSGAGTLSVTAANTFTGGVTISGGTLAVGVDSRKETLGPDSNAVMFTGAGATLRILDDINRSARPYVFQKKATIDTNGFSLVLGGTLSGTAGFVKRGDGMVSLEAANSFSGGVEIQSGTLQLASGAALADENPVVLANAAGSLLKIISSDETIGSLAGGGASGGNADIDAHVLSVGGDGSSTVFGGHFIGSNSSQFRKVGAGTITLSNTATNDAFTGTVRIDAGAVSVAAVESLGKRGTSRLLYLNDAGTLATTADMSFNTRRFELGSTDGAGIAGVFDVQVSTTTALRAVVTGTGGLKKSGGGTLRLADTSKGYAGPTQVVAGVLAIDTTIASAVSVAAAGTLSGTGTLSAAAIIAGIHSPGSSPGTQSFGDDLTYAAGATLAWELVASSTASRGTSYDGVNVAGNLDFTGASVIDLSFNAPSSTVSWLDAFWSTNQSWLVLDVAGTTSNIGSFSVRIEDWLDASGGRFDTLRPGASFSLQQAGQDVTLIYAVPEPAGWLLTLAGAIGGTMVRSLRRRTFR